MQHACHEFAHINQGNISSYNNRSSCQDQIFYRVIIVQQPHLNLINICLCSTWIGTEVCYEDLSWGDYWKNCKIETWRERIAKYVEQNNI